MDEAKWIHEFAKTLNGHMERRDMSQRELAKRAGVSESTISDLRKGERMPSVKTIINISDVFKVKTDELLKF